MLCNALISNADDYTIVWSDNSGPPPLLPAARKQRAWDQPLIEVEKQLVLSIYSDPYHRARLSAVGTAQW
jgi:hypothetical protein